MRLTRLDISGFKSFAKRTELQFGSGITAVIGPNGSGKSNISDAVRWVLGEQSAKALRGTKMEDVIFNGTQKRRPQSMCEVTLTFDNSDHKLPLDFNEVEVMRRMYRSGESEYILNGKNCRLKDIMDLFRDTGIGKDGYSIISQGKVDEILSNKSSDRREALEEAAGVTRYRARKEEAERKLENTEKNMERLLDLLGELGDRLGPLEEQSATARTFLKLRDELKDLEVNMFLYQTDRQTEKLNGLRETLSEIEHELLLGAESDRRLSEQSGELEEQTRELDEKLSEQQKKLIEMLSGVEAHVGESNLLLERREHAKKETERVKTEREQLLETVRASEKILRESELSAEEIEKRSGMDREIEQRAVRVTELDADLNEKETALETAKNAIMEAMNRLADAKSDLSRFETMQTALNERLASLGNEETEAEKKVLALGEELNAAEQKLSEAQDVYNGHVAAHKEAQRNRMQLESDFLAAQAELKILEQNAGALLSRENVLRDMMRSYEGYQNSVKLLMQAAQKDYVLKKCMIGPVAELIDVPKEYETAIGMSLGGAMQNIVTETAEDGKTVIEYARSNDFGRVTLLPLSMLTPNPLDEKERKFLAYPGVIGLASELIRYDKKLESVAEYLLGRTVIVKDLDSAIELKKHSKNAFHIATLLGDFLATGGTMTGGSVKKSSYSFLGREREIEETAAKRKAAEKDASKKQQEIEDLKKNILLADTQTEAFLSEAHQAELLIVRQKEQRDIIARDLLDAKEDRNALKEEREDILSSLEDIEKRRESSRMIQTDIEEKNLRSRTQIVEDQKKLAELRTVREQENEALTRIRIARTALMKEDDAREADRKRTERDMALAAQRVGDYDRELESLAMRIREADERIHEMEQGIAGEQAELGQAKEEQQRLEKERQRLSELLSQFRRRRDDLGESYRQTDERKHRTAVSIERIESDLRSMADRIFNDYELTYENALPLRHDIPIGASNARINELRSEIRALGPINMSAIEDYQNVSERHATLQTQYEDLEKAKDDLYSLIAKITKQMETTFVEEFQKIQENFSIVFAQLFGGGHAELRLSDKNDVLNCEIEIIAQPPGKKLQLLSLLSGGERALTAIALLFAMLRIKAPAFCVLDEIETSLDEENVSKFAEYLTRYSDETQFILITHRKGSMEVCDTLYGVAMEEKGVSSIVSARFVEPA